MKMLVEIKKLEPAVEILVRRRPAEDFPTAKWDLSADWSLSDILANCLLLDPLANLFKEAFFFLSLQAAANLIFHHRFLLRSWSWYQKQ